MFNTQIIGRSDKFFRYSSVISYIFLVAQNFRLWAFPTAHDKEAILTQSSLMAFEFIMVHSGLFMIIFSGSRLYLAVLVVYYGLFVVAFNWAMPNNVMLYTYMFVVLNRMRFLFYDSTKEAKSNLLVYSFVVTVVYFVLTVTFAAMGKGVPPLGLTHHFLTSIDFFSSTSMKGLFIENPQVGIGLSVFYFSALSYIEYRMIRFNGRIFQSGKAS